MRDNFKYGPREILTPPAQAHLDAAPTIMTTCKICREHCVLYLLHFVDEWGYLCQDCGGWFHMGAMKHDKLVHYSDVYEWCDFCDKWVEMEDVRFRHSFGPEDVGLPEGVTHRHPACGSLFKKVEFRRVGMGLSDFELDALKRDLGVSQEAQSKGEGGL